MVTCDCLQYGSSWYSVCIRAILARKLSGAPEQRNKREWGSLFDQKHAGFYVCLSVNLDCFVKYFCI
jgi:hypothetical protein